MGACWLGQMVGGGETHPYILDAFSGVEDLKQQVCQTVTGREDHSGSASE